MLPPAHGPYLSSVDLLRPDLPVQYMLRYNTSKTTSDRHSSLLRRRPKQPRPRPRPSIISQVTITSHNPAQQSKSKARPSSLSQESGSSLLTNEHPARHPACQPAFAQRAHHPRTKHQALLRKLKRNNLPISQLSRLQRPQPLPSFL